ncbi:MAG: nucleotidyltransferase family protein, partial [Sphingomonadales bacterium]
STPANVIILAAGRRGVTDPVAASQNKSHKCLVEIDGRIMLERVIDSLIDCDGIGRIFISIEDEAPLRTVPRLARMLDEGAIIQIPSEGNLADSVIAAARRVEEKMGPDAAWPLVITTGDNALQTPEMVTQFLNAALGTGADVAIAFTRDDVVLRDHPDAGLAFHRLKDGGFSANNLYLLRSPATLDAVGVFKSGGQFGKRHWRILKSFGLLPFVLYKLKATTGENLIRRIGRNLGISTEMILSPYADGPIDVDNLSSFDLCDRILARRRISGNEDQARTAHRS